MTLVSQRWHVVLEFDGSSYYGWQRQPEVITIQEIVEQTLSQIANHKITIYAAGRTDKGVHAAGMSIHFDSYAPRSADIWQRALNCLLPNTIRCHKVSAVTDNFHARHSAISRSYCYKIYNAKDFQPVFQRFNSWWVSHELDILALKKAIKTFEGTHDFSGYRGKYCQAPSPVKTITATDILINGNNIVINITGNSFLHHMVRNMVGAAVLVAQHRQQLDWLTSSLLAKSRVPEIPMAPAHGLTFVKANY